MTARREPSTPPRLPGYDHVQLLGLGGFADVFLYEQHLPRRLVAVKVLLAGHLDDDLRYAFQTEADLMAQLSHHPSIVTIYHADIAPDGRPYLVMEYCARPGLAERYRQERISVAEALRVGVRLASAVETAHRAGILHRDIKPANVLTTDFGWPALTDFGIAATIGHGSHATVGMSIPWSPPEALGEHPRADERSDVYSLVATVYSVLAGRTPFEVPGGDNSAAQLVARIERSPLPPTGRDDVPRGLQELFERGMAKVPARRPASALEVALAFQRVEADLRLPVTPLELAHDPNAAAPAPPARSTEYEDATRVRPVISIAPEAPEVPAPRPAPAPDPVAAAPAPATAGPVDEDAVGLVVAPERPAEAGDPEQPRGSRRSGTVAAVVAGVVVLGAVAGVTAAALGQREEQPGPGDEFSVAPTLVEAVPAPRALTGERQADGSVVFSWDNPDPQAGDQYEWALRRASGVQEPTLVATTTVTVPAADAGDGEVCVEVSIVRADRRLSTSPAQGCAS
ncbi:serine/threonine-protein kinase [Cellulomonas massiliensis]|uniref:serine/threonine-protein kinase n=1 Tax=Cellulomonas massiliensis TaxID=1465811 RepID=UPI00030CEC4C|nr:serine/threonine-protein kinase [Cellulomonas massiliensis]